LCTLQKKLSDDNSADKLPDLPKPFSLKDLEEQPSDQTKVQGTTPNQPVILLPKLIQYSEAGVPITEQEVLIVEGTQERIKTVPWQDWFSTMVVADMLEKQKAKARYDVECCFESVRTEQNT